MDKIQIIILAAGHGRRMNNESLPKVLTSLKGKPLIIWLAEAIKKSGVCERPVIVVGQKSEMIKATLGQDYTYVTQSEQLGTGHAVMVARTELEGKAENIMVLYGDHPLVSSETIKKLTQAHLDSGNVLTMATVKIEDFNDWRKSFSDFGRITRASDGTISAIIEAKDATIDQKNILEVNPSYFVFKADWLWQNLAKLKSDNVQHEYYLTDLPKIAVSENEKITSVEIDPREALGVNTVNQLNSLIAIFNLNFDFCL